jgi:hypothetical protein
VPLRRSSNSKKGGETPRSQHHQYGQTSRNAAPDITGDIMSNDRSANWTLRRALEVAAQQAASKNDSEDTPATSVAKGKAKRFSLDYATWRALIAAPGSHFEPARPAELRIVRFDPARHSAASSELEKRTA